MKSGVTAASMELIGRHTEVARQMRTMYSADLCDTSNDHLVITIDYAQNPLLPSV
ncbi:TPA: hypothetical protein N0F65_004385 [Lagenidium giganteum]|uniref:Uncharacterized protein n=1 Tax=Lagenidium giganteum TaxID=4803 RepID=A0AAV2ZCJ8_9STRA|nr:TPA: hypothetical protein N0F65_004385 [Lagenidium giganteum]